MHPLEYSRGTLKRSSVLSNVITENSGNFSGGGIWSGGETNTFPEPTFRPLIKGNTITRNTADRIGGGIGTWRRLAPEIIDNYIAENVATEGDGGGIYFRALPDDTGAIFRGNTIENNYAGDHGGGFYAASALTDPLEFEFSWNIVKNNTADGLELTGDSGGGVWLAETNAWVHHNTVVSNSGNGPDSSYGGGIVVERIGSPLIEKNIVALTLNGGGIECGDGATPTIRNNLGWQNLPVEGVGTCADWWNSNGNVIADPNFCDADGGDYSLAQNSPAITHVAGPLGAIPIPGCGPVSVEPTTWGRIKAKYGD
jgi:hypothetical protein